MAKIVKNVILKKDFDEILSSNINFEKMKNSSIFVTGATGLIGSLLVKLLLYLNREKSLNLKVLAMVRNIEKAKMLYAEMSEFPELEFIIGDVRDEINYTGKVDYIFHCASVTDSRTMIEKPVETLLIMVNGTENVLNFARSKKCSSVVYISSMEVYGSFVDGNYDVTEDDLGYINPLVVRSNYPESKRLCENLCIAYFEQYNVQVKIARLAQTFGAGILPQENRVFAQFARSVIAGKDIVLHTKGESEGNYCYTSDAIKGLFMILLDGKNGDAYNVANPKMHISIEEMAQMVCDLFSCGKSNVVFDIPEKNIYGYANNYKMKLNSDKLQRLGWKPQIGLIQAYERLILYMNNEGMESINK